MVMNSNEVVVRYLNNLYDVTDSNNKPINIIKNLLTINSNKTIYDTSSHDNFHNDIKSKIKLLKSIGANCYSKNDVPDKVKVDIDNVLKKKKQLFNIYNYIKADLNGKKKLLPKYNKVNFFSKIKDNSKDKNDPTNYRFMCDHRDEVKIIDKLFVHTIRTKFPNIINNDICKTGDKYNISCIELATNNTNDINHVVLLDLCRAFDSVSWDFLEKLLLQSLIRNNTLNIELDEIVLLVDEYLLILKNRNFYYKKKKIDVHCGLSQGLPSSDFIFTLFFQEIIYIWLKDNILIFKINVDFILNVYVDDIYIKILNLILANNIIESLTVTLEKYELNINKQKSKADPILQIDSLEELTDKDIYLGIPFTRNIFNYKNIILEEYKKKHECRELNIKTWNEMYAYIINKDTKKNILNHLFGYLTYKLKPLISYYHGTDCKCTKELIIDFIQQKFII
jgi:hypothetical protein